MLRNCANIAYAMLRFFTRLCSRLAGNSPGKSLLAFWLSRSDCRDSGIDPHDAAKKHLRYWFEAREFIDRQINTLCMQYYEGRHPKHYLWTGHNQYICDNVRPGDRVLDVGCGASQYQQQLADKASEVVGIDINPDRVAQSRLLCRKPNVRFEAMDAGRDLPPGRFDVAICSHVLEHLDDPVSLLRRMSSRIPRLIVKVPLEDSHWMKLVMRDIGMPWMDDKDHRREYTETMLREELNAGGWKVLEMIRGADLRAIAVSSAVPERNGRPDSIPCAE